MRKLNVKNITIFSSVMFLLGGVTACTPRSVEEINLKEENEVVETVPEIEEKISNINETELNVYKTKELFDSESSLLEFVQSKTKKLKEISQSETTQHVKDTLIHSGLALSDFILMDQSIGGMRLSQLTDKGSEVVFNCLFAVDTLAKEKVPEQYEILKSQVIKIKGKFKEIIIDILGEENYEYFGDLKDKAIEKGKEYWENGKQKYKEWREK